MFKSDALDQAVEIAKEFGKGGNVSNAEFIIEQCYNKIVEIAERDGLLDKE
jgi:hypothetical protein